MSFEWKNTTVAEVGVTLVKEITNLLNRSILVQELFVFHKPGQWVKYVLISPENKVSAAETRIPTPKSFDGYQFRHDIELHLTRI
ncbi:hypothetical protein TNIN_137951 [Trichonephila inaurata madagascariensis]|uniref:Uncharacterized protein n=1 Tax=Trichonephila inaurata madagascariensis TaxID=2747483 RepID=A0A8X7BXL3_9ARAC|nr:hypothetical protein TNIN_137951 [Trichonephila inaurata madagascariensis]